MIGGIARFGRAAQIHAIDPVSVGTRCLLADGRIGDDVVIGQRDIVLGGVSAGVARVLEEK